MAEQDIQAHNRRLELKRRLLRKALHGNSKLTPSQMMNAIGRITQENRNPMPAGHQAVLEELSEEDREAAARGEKVPRSIKSLNAQARHKGFATRFKYTEDEDGDDTPPPPSLNPPTIH